MHLSKSEIFESPYLSDNKKRRQDIQTTFSSIVREILGNEKIFLRSTDIQYNCRVVRERT